MLFLKIDQTKNRLKALTLVGAFCFSATVFSQSISGKFLNDSTFNKLYLKEVIGGQGYIIDSCELTENTYSFSLQKRPIGYYRLVLETPNQIDFLHNNEDVKINFTDTILQNGVEVINSHENRLLWDYKYYSRENQKVEKQIIIKQSYFKEGSTEWLTLQWTKDSILTARKLYLLQAIEENNGTLFSQMVKATIEPFYPDQNEQKQHYFDNIDFNNPILVRSSVLPSSYMGYLQNHTEYTEEGFKESVSKILDLASANDEIYEYSLNFLLELFNEVGPDVIFQYLVEEYLIDGGCSEITIGDEFSLLAESYRAVLPGNKAPQITSQNFEGRPFSLSEKLQKRDITVLYFWSSHCGFCANTSPALFQWAEENPQVQIIAISLDENREELKNYLEISQINWEVVTDYKGWSSDIVKSYKIHKTPSFYVLDNEGIILAKPKDVDSLKDY